MLPGLRPRPSLSGLGGHALAGHVGDVLPGLRPRPSLSAVVGPGQIGEPVVLPGLRPRPSLSERNFHDDDLTGGRVAGVEAPAFVERA